MNNIVIFCILSALMLVSAVLAVTSKRTLRSVVYLLFALLGTAGIYMLLNYHFLAMVQIAVYAGGVVVLFVFAVLLVNEKTNTKMKTPSIQKIAIGALTSLVGFIIVIAVILKTKFLYLDNPSIIGDQEIDMKLIGNALLGTGKHEFLLTFEVLSILLLACAIGGILIAQKDKGGREI